MRMSHTTNNADVFDCVRIDGLSDADVEFWACVLEVSAHDIRHAMALVGDSVSAVSCYLGVWHAKGSDSIH